MQIRSFGISHPGMIREEKIFLVADGRYDMVSDRGMLSVIQSNIEKPLSELGPQLVTAANEQGGRDNITVVLVRFDE